MSGRLLFLVNALEPDGPTAAMLALALQARIRGWEVRLAALQRGGPYADTIRSQLGADPVCLGVGPSPLAALTGRQRLGRLLTSQGQNPLTVIAALAAPTLAALSLPRALLRHVRVVAIHHGAHEWDERGPLMAALVQRLMNRFLPRTHLHFAVSPFTAEELNRRTQGRVSCQVLGNMVADSNIDLPLPPSGDEPWRLGGCGRLVSLKNWTTALRAAHLLQQYGIRFRLEIFGDGPDRAALLSLTHQLGLAREVSFPGHHPQWLSQARSWHAMVHPSRMESFGLAPAMVAGLGLPVIHSCAGALPWTLEGCGPCYGSPDNEQALARTIQDLLQQLPKDPVQERHHQEQRRTIIHERHGSEAVWSRFAMALTDNHHSDVGP